KPFETLAGMHEQMKAVGNLHGLGSRTFSSLRILSRPITPDQADMRVAAKPGLEGGTGPIREQVHYPAGGNRDRRSRSHTVCVCARQNHRSRSWSGLVGLGAVVSPVADAAS